MKRQIWRNNFSIKRTAPHMMVPAILDMVQYQSAIIGTRPVRDCIFVFRGYDNDLSLIPIDQLRAVVAQTIHTILRKPGHVERVHAETIRLNDDYLRYAHIVNHTDLSALSDARLAAIFRKLVWFQKISHGTSIATTWFVDSDGEDLSKLLIRKVDELIAVRHSRRSAADVFSSLTTPERRSMAMIEEEESLRIFLRLRKDKKARALFTKGSIPTIKKDLASINPALRTSIIGHYEKWKWVQYTYIGPAYTIDHFLSEWVELFCANVRPEKRLKEIRDYPETVSNRKRAIIRELRIDRYWQRIFAITAEIVYIKGYRKDALYYGCFVIEKIHRELMRRFGLTLKQVRYMTDTEVVRMLQGKCVNKHTLNERWKFALYRQHGLTGTMYSGIAARRLMASLTIEEQKVEDVNILSGTPACAGAAKGTVRIINVPGEMGKMRQGDIMVSHTTFPALVPAMKKAAAIVTDDGGITCHAAIVSRELGTPCVVGTKIATKVLKDGDRVDVDATKGNVTKLL